MTQSQVVTIGGIYSQCKEIMSFQQMKCILFNWKKKFKENVNFFIMCITYNSLWSVCSQKPTVIRIDWWIWNTNLDNETSIRRTIYQTRINQNNGSAYQRLILIS